MTNQEKQQVDGKKDRMEFGVLVALGLSLGAGAGASTGNAGVGSAIGLLVAITIHSYYQRKEAKKSA